MNFQLRMAVGAAATAAVLALLAGVLGGIPFGHVLLRSIIGALVFGGLGFGAAILLEQFLPELFEELEDEPAVDVSVGNEDDSDDLRRELTSASAAERAAESGATAPRPAAAAAVQKSADTEDSVSGFTQDLSQNDEDASSEQSFQNSSDLVEEIHEQPRLEAENAAMTAATDADLAEESLDELPGMDEMADAFITSEAAIEGSDDENTGVGASELSSADAENAREIAKAIQTVLKREKQG